MEQKKSNKDTIKRIVLVMVSVEVGIFFMNILGNIDMNIWFARGFGALVTASIAMFLYHLLIKNTGK